MLATVNEQTMVPFVSQQLNNLELALALAKRGNLPGAEALVGQNFDRLFSMGQFKEAAEAAAESPQVGRVHLCRELRPCGEANCSFCAGDQQSYRLAGDAAEGSRSVLALRSYC